MFVRRRFYWPFDDSLEDEDDVPEFLLALLLPLLRAAPVDLRAVVLRAPPRVAAPRFADDFDDDFADDFADDLPADFVLPAARRAPLFADDFLALLFFAEDFFAAPFAAPRPALRFAAVLLAPRADVPARAPLLLAARLAPPRADDLDELFEPADFFAEDFFATAMVTPPELE